MLEQKDELFYTEYFKKLNDFRLTKDFESQGYLYVGAIEVIDSVHPIEIEVEIPKSFPHHKMVFWTKSLSGYPHLIFGIDPFLKKNISAERGWFCLNTPFAETPEAQLHQELCRLRGWLNRYLHPDLPAHITNKEVIRALQIANRYNWESNDEVQERSHSFGLSFVGEFAQDVDYYSQHKEGVFYCNDRETRSGEFHLYAFKEKENTDLVIPYIVVDDVCSLDQMQGFAQMREFYKWDLKCQERLLPEFDLDKSWKLDTGFYYIYCLYLDLIKQNRSRIVIAPEDKEPMDAAIAELEKEKREDSHPNFLTCVPPDKDDPDFEKKEEEYSIQLALEEQAEREYEEYQYGWHFFVIGFHIENQIIWRLFWTNRSSRRNRKVSYKLGEYQSHSKRKDGTELTNNHSINIVIEHFVDLELNSYPADTFSYNKFFGRGQYCDALVNKNIAIIGAGAIGSTLALALARGGARSIGIWDGDYVEPGNICRSSYRGITIGTQKSFALSNLIKEVSPFCCVRNIENDFYANINYESQEDVIKQLDKYDVIFDCTAANEILHYLSYAIHNKLLLSICITNHAQNLLCISNKTGNPFEIRKAYLAKIEQDTDNYYVEGTGCFDPTFLASNSDINALLNLAIRDINLSLSEGVAPGSVVYSYDKRGIISDHLKVYSLSDKSIKLVVSAETLLDAEDVPDAKGGKLGQLFGTYSLNGKEIFLTNFVPQSIVDEESVAIAQISDNILEYIGEYRYSTENAGEYGNDVEKEIVNVIKDDSVNTLNPLLALRNPDGSLSFYLYIDNKLELFILLDEIDKE